MVEFYYLFIGTTIAIMSLELLYTDDTLRFASAFIAVVFLWPAWLILILTYAISITRDKRKNRQ